MTINEVPIIAAYSCTETGYPVPGEYTMLVDEEGREYLTNINSWLGIPLTMPDVFSYRQVGTTTTLDAVAKHNTNTVYFVTA